MSTLRRFLAVCPALLLAFVPGSAAATATAYVPVCCNMDSTISIVDTATNRVAGSFTAGLGSYAVALPTPDQAWVTNAIDSSVSIAVISNRAVFKTVKLKLQPWLIQASPDGATVYVVTGMFKKSLRHYASRLYVLDVKTAKVTGSAPIPNDGLANPGLAISSDSNRVYATFDSQTVIVYDRPSGRTVATWQTTRALTWTTSGTLTLSADDKTLYTSGQVITAIDTATGNVKGTVAAPGPPRNYSYAGSAISADGSTLYASYALQIGTGSGMAAIDTGTLQVTATAALGGELQQPVLAKNGATLYVPDAVDALVYVVDAATLAATGRLPMIGPIATASLSGDGKFLFVANASTAGVLAVDTASFSVVSHIGVSGPPSAASAPADGSRVYVAGSVSNSVSGIDVAKDKVRRIFSPGEVSGSVSGDNPLAVTVTPDGKRLYLAGSYMQDGVTEIDVASGNTTRVPCPRGVCMPIWMAALPDSSRVYMAGQAQFGEGGIAMFWEVETATGKILWRQAKAGGLLAASPTGTFLYVAGRSELQIFDTTQNAFTGSLPIAGVTAMGFSPDGATVYAAAGSTLHAIDTGSGQVMGSFALGGAASAVSVSPDGSQVWVALAKSTSVVVVAVGAGTSQTVDFGAQVAGVGFGVH